jgi:YesN/AraC family two-component response regulator
MIRVLIVDDQALVRQGIRSLLALASELEVAGEADDGASALERIESTRPDVVLLVSRCRASTA